MQHNYTTTLIFGGSGVCDKGAEDGALGGVDGTEDNSDRVNCGKDICGVGVGVGVGVG